MVQTSVIGCGNMGSALIKGLWRAGNHTVTACDLDPDALESVADYVDRTTSDVSEAAEADVVIVAVKPDIVGAVLEELDLSPEQTLVSIAAGVSTDYVEARTDANVVRIMPNLAAETGDMAAAVTREGVTDEVRELLDDVGEFAEIDESKMDIATAVNGAARPSSSILFRRWRTRASRAASSPTTPRRWPPRRSRGRRDRPPVGPERRGTDRRRLFAQRDDDRRDGSPLEQRRRRPTSPQR